MMAGCDADIAGRVTNIVSAYNRRPRRDAGAAKRR